MTIPTTQPISSVDNGRTEPRRPSTDSGVTRSTSPSIHAADSRARPEVQPLGGTATRAVNPLHLLRSTTLQRAAPANLQIERSLATGFIQTPQRLSSALDVSGRSRSSSAASLSATSVALATLEPGDRDLLVDGMHAKHARAVGEFRTEGGRSDRG